MKKSFLLKSILLLCALMVGSSAWADTSTLNFTAACGGSGTADDGASWAVTSDGTESTFDSTYGIHYGTSSASVTYLQLSTSSIEGTVTQVVVNTRDAQACATVSVTVGGSAFTCSGSTTATNSSANYTFTGSGTGEIVVRVDRGSKMVKAIYVKSVTVTYTPSKAPHGLSWSEDEKAVTYNAGGTYSLPSLSNPNSLTVTYSSNNTDVAEINASTGAITIKNVNGSAIITASTEGNAGYRSGFVSYTLTVTRLTRIPSDGETETFDFSAQGYTNGQEITSDDAELFSITFVDGDGTTPKYYTNGTAIRAYPKNTLTVSSPNDFRRVELTFGSSDGTNTITANVGTYGAGTWRGSAKSVTFTIGGSTGNRRIASVKVYFGEGYTSKTVESYGWGTYIPDHNVEFADNDAFVVTATNVAAGTLTVAEVTSVPAGTPVLLYGAGEKTITINDVAPSAPATNLLSVSDGTVPGGKYAWVLAKNGASAQFKEWKGSAGALDGRVVLLLDNPDPGLGGSRALTITFEGETSAIHSAQGTMHNEGSAMYDLQGRRLDNAQFTMHNAQLKKGLYVVNGKKYIVK